MADTPETRTTIVVPASQPMVAVLGTRDELLRVVEQAFPSTDVSVRGNEISVSGSPGEVALVERLYDELVAVLRTGQALTPEAVERMVTMLRTETGERPADVLTLNILSNRGRTIRPKTLNQKRYVDAIDRNTVVFGIGPAGTGKTYLAMAKAVQALQAKQVTRIILTRPAVEAGERLGFLPGTLYEKIDPYLRPLYDALHDMIDPESIPRLMTAGTIEVAPLAYMRGRAQPVTTPVLTPHGFRPLGALQVGDLVIGSDGFPTPVLGVFPQGRRPVFRVSAQDGASTLACAEHLWVVTTPDDRRNGRAGRVVRTSDLAGDLRDEPGRRFELPLAGPVQMVPQPVPVDPYELGRRLARGGRATRMTPTAPAEALAGAPGRGGVALASPVAEQESVPREYLHNSPDVRLGVLQGLLDASGGLVHRPGRPCRVRFSTGSARLRDDVVFLVRSLGGVAASSAPRDPNRLDIRLPAGLSPFRLARNREAYDEAGVGRPARYLQGIRPAGDADCVCISVAAEDSLYVTEDFLVTHNTLNDAFIILDEAQNTSPEQMKMFLTRLGFGSKMVVTGDVTQVDLPGGTHSGLRVVQDILEGTSDVEFCHLQPQDVVRHRLVTDIVEAYGRWDAGQRATESRRSGGAGSPGRRRR